MKKICSLIFVLLLVGCGSGGGTETVSAEYHDQVVQAFQQLIEEREAEIASLKEELSACVTLTCDERNRYLKKRLKQCYKKLRAHYRHHRHCNH